MSMNSSWPKDKVATVYDHPIPVVDCSKDKRLTVQADLESADVNKIIARFEKAGMQPLLTKGDGFFGDVSEFDGLQEALIMTREANERFMDLPANIRERFSNDPIQLIAFLDNGANRKEAEELGLVEPLPAPAAPAPSSPPAGGS